MLTHRFPYPPNRGDRIRSYHLLRVLTNEFCVTLGAIADEPVRESDRAHVEAICEQLVIDRPSKIARLRGAAKSVICGKSLTEGMFASASLSQQIQHLHRENPFDAVLVFCSSMFQFVDHPDFERVPVVVDLVDVDSCKWEQMSREARFPKSIVFRRETRCVRELEQRIANSVEAVTLVSAAEANLFRDTVSVPDSLASVGVSNGVDTSFFDPGQKNLQTPTNGLTGLNSPPDQLRRELGTEPQGCDPIQLVFTGVLNYYPNVSGLEWFCNEVLPVLRETTAVYLKIVGRSPNPAVNTLGRLDGVELVGPVTDVRPYLAAADIAISPLKLARGIQNKVLEAMAMGCPVVCTSPSAEGIDGVDGKHFVVADTVAQWCRAISDLSVNATLRQQMSVAARERVVNSSAWTVKLQPMLDLLIPNRDAALSTKANAVELTKQSASSLSFKH